MESALPARLRASESIDLALSSSSMAPSWITQAVGVTRLVDAAFGAGSDRAPSTDARRASDLPLGEGLAPGNAAGALLGA